MKKKLICFISPNAYPLLSNESESHLAAGGAEIQLSTIGLKLAAKNTIIFIVNDFGQPDIEYIGKLAIYKSNLRYLDGKKLYLLFDWINLVFNLKRINPDIVLLKIPKELLIPTGLYCKVFRKRLIYIGQSDKDVDIKLLLQLQNKIAVLLYRLGLLLVDHFVAQTRLQLNGFKGFNNRVSLIKNIVTFPSELNSSKKKYILWVGNGNKNKQPEVFIRLAKRLSRYKFKMILFSPDQKKMDSHYSKLVSSLNNLEYIGYVPFNKIANYFANAYLLVNTSVMEGFPNIFLQAWQCSTPVISLNVNPDNVITKYSIGRVSCCFENMLKDVICLMENSKLREEMALNADQYINDNHSVEKIISNYQKLIDS